MNEEILCHKFCKSRWKRAGLEFKRGVKVCEELILELIKGRKSSLESLAANSPGSDQVPLYIGMVGFLADIMQEIEDYAKDEVIPEPVTAKEEPEDE